MFDESPNQVHKIYVSRPLPASSQAARPPHPPSVAPTQPPTPKYKRWKFRDVLLIFLTIVGVIILGGGAMTFGGNALLSGESDDIREIVVYMNAATFVFIMVGLMTLFVGFLRGYRFADFGFRTPSLAWVLLAIGIGVVFIPIRIAIIFFIALIFAPDLLTNQEDTIFTDTLDPNADFSPLLFLSVFQLGLMVVVLAPLVEELVFRGTLQTWMTQRFGVVAAVLVSGTLFGLAHIDPLQATANTILGIVMGIAYYYSRSLWIPILIHFTNNFLIALCVGTAFVFIILAGG